MCTLVIWQDPTLSTLTVAVTVTTTILIDPHPLIPRPCAALNVGS